MCFLLLLLVPEHWCTACSKLWMRFSATLLEGKDWLTTCCCPGDAQVFPTLQGGCFYTPKCVAKVFSTVQSAALMLCFKVIWHKALNICYYFQSWHATEVSIWLILTYKKSSFVYWFSTWELPYSCCRTDHHRLQTVWHSALHVICFWKGLTNCMQKKLIFHCILWQPVVNMQQPSEDRNMLGQIMS